MHNVKQIAKGLCWFYIDVGPKNATTKQSYFIQTYVWAESMGRSVEKQGMEMERDK